MTTATDLGSTIRAWRDRLPPAAAGLPARRGRRTTGLRREELAELAGVSVDYVVRLEQGRATTPSAQVVAALARALQLSTDERDHLFRLASLAPPSSGLVSEHLTPSVHRVLSRLDDAAVAVFAADWQLVWWNSGWAALLGDPATVPVAVRNFARCVFPVAGDPATVAQWPVVVHDQAHTEAAVASDLRRATGRFPHDPRLAALVTRLLDGNARFAELWADGTVSAHREDRKVVHHPAVGPVTVDCDTLTDGEADLKIVVMTAVPGSDDESRFRLALLAGVQGEDVVRTRAGS
ncbi:helix-turn-helix domain-containing protein [Nocardioides rubriscoriae]|uniref:helix-turn-helix domain-containing protein n=1 Tax=Nocardioides rubriscoriae TaxID=642762 RepID=UPI001B87C17D|nr:helix-turn-helix transcriptional regulator [Nocardioides rubriscoriae]